MKLELTQKRLVNGSFDSVYALLSHSDSWQRLHSKIVRFESDGDFCSGLLIFKGKRLEFVGERFTNGTNDLIYTLLMLDEKSKEMRSTISYKLTAKGTKTLVSETVSYDQEIPAFLCFILNLMHRFGKPTEKTSLERLELLL